MATLRHTLHPTQRVALRQGPVQCRSMNERILDTETRYRLLRCLADDPGLSQRKLAQEFGKRYARDTGASTYGPEATGSPRVAT